MVERDIETELNMNQNIFGKVTDEQLQDLRIRAKENRVLSSVGPHNTIKVSRRVNGLRVVVDRQMKPYWDSELFTDPLLRKFRVKPFDNIHVGLIENEYCCLFYPEIHQYPQIAHRLLRNKPTPEAVKYIDYRLVAGVKAPMREFNKKDMLEEKKRIQIKEGHIIGCLEDQEDYLQFPSFFDRYLTDRGSFKNSKAGMAFSPAFNLPIYIGNNEYRVVRTKIEQWVWEQYVKLYANSNKIRCLNTLLYDDDRQNGICRIYVPVTKHNQDLYTFIKRFTDPNMLALIAHDEFCMYNEIC